MRHPLASVGRKRAGRREETVPSRDVPGQQAQAASRSPCCHSQTGHSVAPLVLAGYSVGSEQSTHIARSAAAGSGAADRGAGSVEGVTVSMVPSVVRSRGERARPRHGIGTTSGLPVVTQGKNAPMWVFFVVLAWVAAFAACGRLCRTAVAAANSAAGLDRGIAPEVAALSLYETAFLSGGPQRLTDVTLVAMSEERRLILAHTGWATVVDPEGRDEIERSVITAIGPGGQSPIPPVRTALAAAEAVHTLADRLVTTGLAVPESLRSGLAAATRQVRHTALLVPAAALASELVAGAGDGAAWRAPWFALPFALTLGTLAIARWEMPFTRWASPAGAHLLRTAAEPAGDRAGLVALARRGIRALPQAELRAALGGGRAVPPRGFDR